MKIIGLLSALFLTTLSSIQGTMISLDGTTLEITKQGHVLTIDGSGRHTFEISLGDETFDYSMNQVSTETGSFLIQGYILNTKERTYDPFLLDLEKDGTMHVFHIFKDELNQDIKGAYPLNNGFLVHLESVIDNHQGDFNPYKHHLGILINDTFEVIKTNDRITNIKEDFTGYFVYFNYENTPRYMFGFNGELINEEQILGIEIHGQYEGKVELQFLGEATLNKMSITSPFTVTTPGKYTFIKSGKVIPFTLNPIVSGVIANTIYSDPVSIEYTSGQAYLNDRHYAPGEEIFNPGHYLFGIYGDNYIFEIPFTITADIQGISPMKTYFEPVEIHFEGDAYLNNEYIRSGTIIDEPGNYTLKVFGVNKYLETISFKIESDENTDSTIWIERGLLGGSFLIGVSLLGRKILKKRKK